MANVYTERGYVYSIQYHIAWCVKYRHDVITGEIEKSVKKILRDIANDTILLFQKWKQIKTITVC